MSLQLPEPRKRELPRMSKHCSVHVGWRKAGFPQPVDGLSTVLPFPEVGTSFPQEAHPGSAELHPAEWLLPGPSSPHWRVPGTHFLSYLGSCSSAQFISFFVKQAGKHNLSGHVSDPATQLKSRALSSCSLPCFLWRQILIFLMTKQVFTRSGRLRILIPSFRGSIVILTTPLSKMFQKEKLNKVTAVWAEKREMAIFTQT